MDKNKFTHLLGNYADNSITPAEYEEFLSYLQAHPGDEISLEAGEEFFRAHEHLKIDVSPYEHIARDIVSMDRVKLPRQKGGLLASLHMRRFVVAAAVLLVVCTSVFLWLQHSTLKQASELPQHAAEISPGREGAILTRADGSTVLLDSLAGTEMTEKNGVRLLLEKGQLSYQGKGAEASTAPLIYNTVATPNARVYHLILQDGTAVWLNAGSSITYPVVFSEKERRIKITGEVYLEVAKNKESPFVINVNNQKEVQVLGTSFNINAYTNEPVVRTSLVEGIVSVTAGQEKVLLHPGQQAEMNNPSFGNKGAANAPKAMEKDLLRVSTADLNAALAWRNGLFTFRNADVREVMRQVERWYDVEVRMEGDMPARTFSGEIERELSLQQLLAILKVMGINYTIDNQKQITIKS